jgi:FkbM family methyltransferase
MFGLRDKLRRVLRAEVAAQVADKIASLPPPTAPEFDLRSLHTRFENAISDRADYVLPHWWNFNFWEPTVQLALRDLCRPRDVVFDVGANAGGLSLAMSRLVGLDGRVYAFEASKRIVGQTQFNMTQQGCTNVQLFHNAVYRKSGEKLPIFYGDHLNDSIMEGGGAASSEAVETIALDDFCAHWGVAPNLIKIDIEGAEYEALLGMPKVIAGTKPHLILEQSPHDMRGHALLAGAGYCGIDLATYREIKGVDNFVAGSGLANVLYVHRDRLSDLPYAMPLHLDDMGACDTEMELGPGRYVIEADMAAEQTFNMLAGIEIDGAPAARYETSSSFLTAAYRFYPIQIDRPSKVTFFHRFTGEPDPTFALRGLHLRRVVMR